MLILRDVCVNVEFGTSTNTFHFKLEQGHLYHSVSLPLVSATLCKRLANEEANCFLA